MLVVVQSPSLKRYHRRTSVSEASDGVATQVIVMGLLFWYRGAQSTSDWGTLVSYTVCVSDTVGPASRLPRLSAAMVAKRYSPSPSDGVKVKVPELALSV